MRFFWKFCLIELLFTFKAKIQWPGGNANPLISKKMLFPLDTLKKLQEERSATSFGQLTPVKIQLLRKALKYDRLKGWALKNRLEFLDDGVTHSLGWYNGAVERTSSTSRLINVLVRSLQGQNISVVVMGGSNSAGGGLGIDKEDFRGLYYRVFARWWQETVQPITGSKIILHNLSVGGTSSNFFAFCYRTLLNSSTTMDIVLLDFTVNDFLQFKDSKFPMAFPLEQLTREILLIEKVSSPSLIYVNFVQGISKTPVCNNLENNGQTALANNYGITSVSLRKFLCLRNTDFKQGFTEMFALDGVHASIFAHWKIALMLINYTRKTMLEVLHRLNQRPRSKILVNPLLPLQNASSLSSTCTHNFFSNLQKPVFPRNRAVKFHDKPFCFTHITPDGTENGTFHQTLKVEQVRKVGFYLMPKHFINQTPQKSRTDAFGGWKAQSSNSWLKLDIFIPKVTEKCIPKLNESSLRNVAIATRTDSNGATASIWLDNNENKAISINAHSSFGHTRLNTIARNVTPGHHLLSVRTETPGTFILSGVMTGPSYN